MHTAKQLQENFVGICTHKIETPYLAFTGELRGVFRELYEEKWPLYIESTLYYYKSFHQLTKQDFEQLNNSPSPS